MLKLNKMTDYAVVALLHLWQEAPMQKNASDLASETGLPETTLSKILKKLASAGLLQSRRGAGGGYFVEQEIGNKTSIWQIIEAIEGPVSLTTCIDGEELKDCCIKGSCPLQSRWGGVNDAIYGVLDKVMLSDMQDDEFLPSGAQVPSGAQARG